MLASCGYGAEPSSARFDRKADQDRCERAMPGPQTSDGAIWDWNEDLLTTEATSHER
jgi:hypothetical protein